MGKIKESIFLCDTSDYIDFLNNFQYPNFCISELCKIPISGMIKVLLYMKRVYYKMNIMLLV